MGWRKNPDSEEDRNDELLDEMAEETEIEISHGTYVGLAGFALGLAVGAFLGAGAALLTAPLRGESMRRKLRHGVEDLSDDLRDRADRFRNDTERRVDRTRRRLRKVRRRS